MNIPVSDTAPASGTASAQGSVAVGGEAHSLLARETLWMFGKGAREQLSENFFTREFCCRCNSTRCHFTLVHPRLVEVLQTLRHLLARPLIITSGFRCRTHNKIAGGRPRSYHTRGMAADILCHQPEHMEELIEAASDISAVGGIGRYSKRRFVHLDVRPREPFTNAATWSS